MINNISFTSITRLLVGVGLVLFIGCGSTKRPVNAKGERVIDSTGRPNSQSAFKPKPKIKSKQKGQMAPKNKDLPSDEGIVKSEVSTTDTVDKKGISYSHFNGEVKVITFQSKDGTGTYEFDVVRNNPYNVYLDLLGNVPYHLNIYHSKVYELDGIEVPDELKKVLYSSAEYGMFKDLPISYVETLTRFMVRGDYGLLVYRIITNTGEYNLLSDMGIAIVFNKFGEEILRIENLVEITPVSITTDGRFLVITHSGEQVYDAVISRKPKLVLYDVTTKKKIYEEIAPDGVLDGALYTDDADMIPGRLGKKRILINPYEGIYYSKYIHHRRLKKGTPEWYESRKRSKEKKFVRRTKKGIIYRNTSTGKEFLKPYDILYTTKRKL